MAIPAEEFARVRVWGSIGWIAAGLAISFVFSWDSASALQQGLLSNTFLMGAVSSAILGVYCFTLPKTPPVVSRDTNVSVKEALGLDALNTLKARNLLIFVMAPIT